MKRTKAMIYQPTAQSNELVAYITGGAYSKDIGVLLQNLQVKMQMGKYNKIDAINSYYSLVSDAALKYQREYFSNEYKFSVTEKFTAAVDLEAYYLSEVLS